MKKILLVEDDALISEMYVNKLSSAGFEVAVAKDGDEAIAKTKEIKPDLILLDVVLPKKDGFEILKEIKEYPETKNIKAIFLTNLGEEENIKRGREAQADAYLIKAHSTPSEIVEKIKEMLGESQTNK
jgi:DNA-binding response OmpR family regulator